MIRAEHKIYCGDFFDKSDLISDSEIDCVLTDLPFGQTNSPWDTPLEHSLMWKVLKRIVKKDAAIILFGDEIYSAKLMLSNEKFYKHKWIWWKNRASNFLKMKHGPADVIEDILVFSFGKLPYFPQKSQGHTPTNFARRKANASPAYNYHKEVINQAGNTDRHPTNVLMFNSVDNNSPERYHTNQKPVDLLQYLLRSYSEPGQKVLDFTAGSFSTNVACELEKRNSIGIEKNPEDCAIGEARIKRAQGYGVTVPRKIKDIEYPLF